MYDITKFINTYDIWHVRQDIFYNRLLEKYKKGFITREDTFARKSILSSDDNYFEVKKRDLITLWGFVTPHAKYIIWEILLGYIKVQDKDNLISFSDWKNQFSDMKVLDYLTNLNDGKKAYFVYEEDDEEDGEESFQELFTLDKAELHYYFYVSEQLSNKNNLSSDDFNLILSLEEYIQSLLRGNGVLSIEVS